MDQMHMQLDCVSLFISGPGVPRSVGLLLAPQKWRASISRSAGDAGIVAVMTAVAASACLSSCTASALADLAEALQGAAAGASLPAQKEPVSAKRPDPVGSRLHTDDLSCGLFSLSSKLQAPPGIHFPEHSCG